MTDIGLANIHLRRRAESRSLSAENPSGAPGGGAQAIPTREPGDAISAPARELGQGWKVRPCIRIPAGTAVTLMDHDGPGVIRHLWMTFSARRYRDLVIRIWWDGSTHPSVQCPVGDFFCNAWDRHQTILAQPINVNPASGLNCYFPMPFRRHARIEISNEAPEDIEAFFYQIDYSLESVGTDALYFHAHWNRSNPLPYGSPHILVEGIEGAGHYVGTFLAWEQKNLGWWGEGELKMYIDGDDSFPTICGTGTEDYFGGAWCHVTKAPPGILSSFPPAVEGCESESYSAPYLGWIQVKGKNLRVGCRMSMYRFHLPDPVFFRNSLKVTIQALGWQSEGRYLPLQDDVTSVSYWYQTLPNSPLSALAPRQLRQVARKAEGIRDSSDE